ncbi:MAG: thiol reductant ABC exporter subunit CydC [Lentisphaerota bacterium]
MIKLFKIILPYRKWMLLGLLLSLLTLGSGIGLMATGAFLITLASTHPLLGTLQLSIVGVRFFGTSRGVFRYFERLVTHDATFKLLKEYRVVFYKKIEPCAPAILHKHNSSDLLRRLVSDIESLDNIYIRLLLPLFALFALIVSALSLIYFNAGVSLTIALALLFAGFIIPLIFFLASKKHAHKAAAIHSQISIETKDMIEGINDITLFSQTENFKNRFLSLGNSLKLSQKKLYFSNASSNGIINFAFSVSIVMVLYFIALGVSKGINGPMAIATVVIGSLASYEIIQLMSSAFQKLGSTIESSQRVFEVLDSVGEQIELPAKKTIPSNFDIEFANVSFKYSQDDKFELENLNFTIRHKETVLILGASGSGKSSLGNLMMNFYTPSDGAIKVGNTNIKEIGQYEIPNYIGLCEQKSYIFNETLKENLMLSGKLASQSEIGNALNLAQADSFIGLDLLSGGKGVKMSAGQLKRLAIARTILSDAPIMIFDEPFANLGANTSNNLFEGLISLNGTKTVIIITHTLPESFEKIDRIIIMNEGRIEVVGSPSELKKHANEFYMKCRNYC